MNISNNTEFLTRQQAASYLQSKGCEIKVSTLATWATTKRYKLPLYHIGRWVRYRRSDLDSWIESRRTKYGAN